MEIERVYELIAEGIDKAGTGKGELFLVKLSLALANLVGDGEQVANAVSAAGRDL
jgi:hypothetical protein